MVYLFLALILYTAAILVGASAARNINIYIASAINTLFSTLIPLVVAIPLLSKKTFHNQKYGIVMAVLGGIIISLFAIALNKSFTQNKIGIVSPVVFGGAILLSTIISYFVFKEKIKLIEGIGLVFVLAGLGIIIYARAMAK